MLVDAGPGPVDDPTAALAPPASHPIPVEAYADLVGRLGYDVTDPDLFGRALTHRSWCAEHAGFTSNERLEFLGDSVLGLAVTDEIYRRFGDASEGLLSRVRAAVVCSPALAEMAIDLGIGPALLLGKGEAASGGRSRPSILADAMEAVIGAIYLDGGLAAATEVVLGLVGPRLDTAGAQDHKSLLHELMAKERQQQVVYEITEDGPEHDKTFRAVVVIDGRAAGNGSGRTKKQAEQAAAHEAWAQIEHQRGDTAAREDITDG
jgi:ribonuclease-3